MELRRININDKRTYLVEYKDGIALYIPRKSRVIVKDIEKILIKKDKFKDFIRDKQFYLLTTAPICSKSKKILEEHNIIFLENLDKSKIILS